MGINAEEAAMYDRAAICMVCSDGQYRCPGLDDGEHVWFVPLSTIEAALDGLRADVDFIAYGYINEYDRAMHAADDVIEVVRRALLGPSENGDTDG